MSTQIQITPADYHLADKLSQAMYEFTAVTNGNDVRERVAQIIAAHRMPTDLTSYIDYDEVLRQRGLTAAFAQAADDANKLRAYLAGSAQAQGAAGRRASASARGQG